MISMAVLTAVAVAFCVAAAIRAFTPQPVPLELRVGRAVSVHEVDNPDLQYGDAGESWLVGVVADSSFLAPRLRFAGITPKQFVRYAIQRGAFGAAVAFAVALFRLESVPIAVLAAAVGAGLGVAWTVSALSKAIELRHRAGRRHLSGLLRAVSVKLAAEASVNVALRESVAERSDWLCEAVGLTIRRSEYRPEISTADAISTLGTEIGLVELVQVGQAVSLASAEGMNLAATLRGQARVLRAGVEQDNARALDRRRQTMFVAVAPAMIGFLGIFGFGLLSAITSSTG